MDLIKQIEYSLHETKSYELWWFSQDKGKIISIKKNNKNNSYIYTLNTKILFAKGLEKILVSSNERVINIIDHKDFKVISPSELELLIDPIIARAGEDIFFSVPKLWQIYHPDDLPEAYSLRLSNSQTKILSTLSPEQLKNIYNKPDDVKGNKENIAYEILNDADLTELNSLLIKLTRMNIECRALMPEGFLSILPSKDIKQLSLEVDEFYKNYRVSNLSEAENVENVKEEDLTDPKE